MIEIVFIDLDGTLLSLKGESGFNKYISEENLKALNKANDSGIILASASGRNSDYTRDNINEKYGFNFDIVAANGALIYHQDEVIGHYVCDKQKIFDLAKYIEDKEDLVGFIVNEKDEHYFLRENTKLFDEFLAAYKVGQFGTVHVLKSLDMIFSDDFIDPLKMCISTPSLIDTQMWEKVLIDKFGDDFEIYSSTNHFLEIMPKGVHKGLGIKKVCERYGISLDKIATIGDGANDVFMFDLTPNSYVMSHANDSVKKRAKHVVDSVSEALEMIITHNSLISDTNDKV